MQIPLYFLTEMLLVDNDKWLRSGVPAQLCCHLASHYEIFDNINWLIIYASYDTIRYDRRV